MPERVKRLLPVVLGADLADARLAAETLHLHLLRSPIRIVRQLDRALRDPRTRAHVTIHLDDIDNIGEGQVAGSLLGIATLQRSGYRRQDALTRLAAHTGRLPTAFVIRRLNDTVPAIRAQAERQAAVRIETADLDDLLGCLPLIARLDRLRHTADSPIIPLAAARLRRPEAVLAAFDHSDDEVRLAALSWNAEQCQGVPTIAPTLRRALTDPSNKIRCHAAMLACIQVFTPRAVLEGLLPLMEADRSVRVRRYALRARARQGPATQALTTAAFDHNAGVRHLARRYLQRRNIPVEYRERALEILRDPDARRDPMIGALAVLSDLGGEADIPLVARFTTDPRGPVRREAERTLSML